MAKKTMKKTEKATKAPRARRSAPSREKAPDANAVPPEPDPAPTGEPGPPPEKGKVTGITLGLVDDGEADGATATQTEGTPEIATPKKAARKRGEILYRHEDGRVACAHHAHIRPGSEHYGTGWKQISKTERLRLHNKGEAPVCEGCAKMEAKKRAKVKAGLYWNERGQINCEEHIPYPGSDTWIFEHWKPIDRASAKEAKEKGMKLACETCKAIAERANAPAKGRKKKESAPKRFSNRPSEPTEPDMTVTRLAEAYLRHLGDLGKSLATQFSYSMDLGIAKRELGPETRIADLTPERVAAFFESPAVTMRKNGKPKTQVTIDKTRRVLRMALEWAEEENRIAKAPLPTTTTEKE